MKLILIFISQTHGIWNEIAGAANAVGNLVTGEREKCIHSYSEWKDSVTCGTGERTRTYQYYMCELKIES